MGPYHRPWYEGWAMDFVKQRPCEDVPRTLPHAQIPEQVIREFGPCTLPSSRVCISAWLSPVCDLLGKVTVRELVLAEAR